MVRQNSIAWVPVSDHEYAQVDLDDLPKVLGYVWCKTAQGYAHTRIPNSGKPGKRLLMHRLLCEGALIDHINRNKLDNRQSNLRCASKQQNALNSAAAGVYLNQNKKWVAQVSLDGKTRYLGSFVTRDEALAVRRQAVEKIIYEGI